MKHIIFWGTPEFALPSLDALHSAGYVRGVVTQPDKRQGRGRKESIPPPVKAAAQKYQIPLAQPEEFDGAFREWLNEHGPATFFVVAYGTIIPDSILALSELPAINLHPSLLPEFRGASPIEGALMQGRELTGLTLMQLDSELDHGPILAQKKIAIRPTESYTQLSEKLSLASAQFVGKYIPQYLSGALEAIPQDHVRATHCKRLTLSDGALNLSNNTAELYNMIRALNPRPGTFIMWNGKRVKIIDARPVKGTRSAARFSRSENGKLILTTRDGMLEVVTVQLEGKKPMSSADFLNGYPEILG